MEINIRKAVIANFKGLAVNDIKESIEMGIQSGEETVLPGLGVLFEIHYNALDDQGKQTLLTALSREI